MAFKINPSKCAICHGCVGVCPMGAITIGADGKPTINAAMCVSCGTCAATCPATAIEAA